MNNSIEIYRSQDGSVQLNVKLENETVWLSANQMAMLFDRDAKTIRKHINNVFADGELTKESNTHFLRVANSDKPVPFYNLDVIISVGYRVKSQQGVQFRRWATSVLKQYLIKGYAINQQIKLDRYNELKDVVRLMSRAVGLQDKVTTDEYSGLFNVISDYVYALDTLDQYDYQSLSISKTTKDESFRATYDNAMEAINALKEKFGGSKWFANEKDDSFKSSIGQIYQTFGGEELYPSVEEKAAMLLYLVVKNHSFSDGNKRIAAMLFLWFLNNNRVLYAEDGHKRIADNTLVALTLMIAESRTEEKDVMVKVVVNLINRENQ
ncbi:virulence protein RhuM/Fic/DOC family protein [Leyella stercorea]|jgi:prophage maintenance system killer protein/prophage antirepressor-like protein|uniref:virulence protein RhuM/Fic/DOC family protein n=1 Tax=Leyella stercorea TaxID=363265 RepID=UPI00243147F5|nr:virulence protein RhuM/Fic/DOC family protein [Leyella stercorea]